jgi:hypothetical protein
MTGNHLIPTTIEFGRQSGSTRVSLNPASRIQPLQSAPVKSKPEATDNTWVTQEPKKFSALKSRRFLVSIAAILG